jgi:hypothetical protein
LLLGDHLSARLPAGAVLILAGVFLARRPRAARRTSVGETAEAAEDQERRPASQHPPPLATAAGSARGVPVIATGPAGDGQNSRTGQPASLS